MALKIPRIRSSVFLKFTICFLGVLLFLSLFVYSNRITEKKLAERPHSLRIVSPNRRSSNRTIITYKAEKPVIKKDHPDFIPISDNLCRAVGCRKHQVSLNHRYLLPEESESFDTSQAPNYKFTRHLTIDRRKNNQWTFHLVVTFENGFCRVLPDSVCVVSAINTAVKSFELEEEVLEYVKYECELEYERLMASEDY